MSVGQYGLAAFLEQFSLTINDLVDECGRPRDTLYTWFKNDRQLLLCVIRSRLSSDFVSITDDVNKKLTSTRT
ncbi:hypothetical protein AB733_23065 [Photobacterium swingsii]|uniref:Uncharacterized protein n=1 Tax=Photobacterium swingsii TaxID=680026 RepID=A0A0J8V545_9GAMM|nr:hypothetical protein AB733_23065 [Photobacterium swingsii]PSW24529.1 hypothetical protein C9I94_10865 [Photobacterium swingsii]